MQVVQCTRAPGGQGLRRPGGVLNDDDDDDDDDDDSFIHSFIQEFIRCPFKKSTQRRPQPSHGDTDQS